MAFRRSDNRTISPRPQGLLNDNTHKCKKNNGDEEKFFRVCNTFCNFADIQIIVFISKFGIFSALNLKLYKKYWLQKSVLIMNLYYLNKHIK